MSSRWQATQGNWRQFLRLGEQLLEQASAAEQVELIADLVKEKTGCDSRVWLAKPFYPLPGEPGVDTLPNPEAPELVNRTHADHRITYELADGTITRRARAKQIVSLAIPLSTQHSLLGVLEVIRCNPEEAIPPDEMDYLVGLASHAAVNMQISRQVALKNWRYDQLNLISAVSDQISNITDLNQMCRQATQSIAQTFNYNYVAIFILDAQEAKVNFQASAGTSVNLEEQPGFSIPFGEGLIGYAAEHNQVVYSPDVSQDARYRFIES
ncbi:MAG: hypothetical protein HPY76_14130, partial [Anaerolineae bacterium]|nr:hypothetical protein [Anaerolineae bacterium]